MMMMQRAGNGIVEMMQQIQIQYLNEPTYTSHRLALLCPLSLS